MAAQAAIEYVTYLVTTQLISCAPAGSVYIEPFNAWPLPNAMDFSMISVRDVVPGGA